jgi:hypothetical protein
LRDSGGPADDVGSIDSSVAEVLCKFCAFHAKLRGLFRVITCFRPSVIQFFKLKIIEVISDSGPMAAGDFSLPWVA